jgi:hypothetical protein
MANARSAAQRDMHAAGTCGRRAGGRESGWDTEWGGGTHRRVVQDGALLANALVHIAEPQVVLLADDLRTHTRVADTDVSMCQATQSDGKVGKARRQRSRVKMASAPGIADASDPRASAPATAHAQRAGRHAPYWSQSPCSIRSTARSPRPRPAHPRVPTAQLRRCGARDGRQGTRRHAE